MCKGTSRHQAQPKAHHPAHNEGGPPVPPGRQRTMDITSQAVPSRPREEGISLAPHAVPPSSQARRGPGAAMVLSRIGCHRAPFGSFPREGKNASHIRGCAREQALHVKRKNTPRPRHGPRDPALRIWRSDPAPRHRQKPLALAQARPLRRNRRPASKSPASPQASGPSLRNPLRRRLMIYYLSLSLPCKAKPGNYRRALPVTRH